MSFFDEQEETRVRPPGVEARRRPRGGGSRPPGGGRTPPRGGGRSTVDERTIRTRQGVAGGALLVVVILIVIGIHSCTVSASNSALKSYNDSVFSLIRSSNQTGQQFFALMSGGTGSSNPTTLTSDLDSTRIAAGNELKRAEGLSAPGQLAQAQQALVWAMRMRHDGITNIAAQVQPALLSSRGTTAVNTIAAEMDRLYASDALYKDYTLPMIESALRKAGIAVGGANGEPVDVGQFVPNIQWLTPAFVAAELKVSYQASTASCSGLHGHSLNSVSVGGTTLQPGATNTISGSPPPVFSLNITNGGNATETGVQLKVSLSPGSISGRTVLPQTTAGETTTGQVTLSSSVPAGSYTATAEVVPVPCEKNTSNNTLTFPITVP